MNQEILQSLKTENIGGLLIRGKTMSGKSTLIASLREYQLEKEPSTVFVEDIDQTYNAFLERTETSEKIDPWFLVLDDFRKETVTKNGIHKLNFLIQNGRKYQVYVWVATQSKNRFSVGMYSFIAEYLKVIDLDQ